jgi:hypothetical protein
LMACITELFSSSPRHLVYTKSTMHTETIPAVVEDVLAS